jgi:uncharacterized protein (DUF169 family)/RNAse (barnase) inhibitor barstar
MKRYELDGRLCLDRGDFCRRLIELLNFPEYCGKNLDALYDALTSLPEPTELTVTHFAGLERRLGDWGRRLRKMLMDASEGTGLWVLLPEEKPMPPEACREAGRILQEELILRYSPIALKLLRTEEDIPEGTVRPWRDEGNRLAMCQAYALVRRNRKAYTLLKEDHWCVWPLVSYRLCPLEEADYEYMGSKFFVRDPRRGVRFLREEYPMLKEEGILGFSIAPLEKCTFVPDLVCIYCNPAQIRSLLMAAKFLTGEMLKLTLDPVDSCVHSSIPVLNGLDFNITFPDPGEYERGLTDENEVMFTLRGDLLEPLTDCVRSFGQMNFGYRGLQMEMDMNFPRPEFYNKMFEKWGLATGEEWKK